MADIVISEFMDEEAIETAFSGMDVLYDPALVDDEAALYAALTDARALIVRNRTQVRENLLDKAPQLKVVGRLGVGLDNIDLNACQNRGIAVCPATGANDLSVSEYVISCALSLLRGAYNATARVAAGEWPRTELMGCELSGKQMGLVGFGAIARNTAEKASALGMSIAAFDPFLPEDHAAWAQAKKLSFEALLETSDVVSLHVPLTDDTRHIIDSAALAKMQSGAVLINAARGGTVDESALVDAINAGKLAGAALDVFEQEPLDATSGAKFLGVNNLILTPHIAGVTLEGNVRVSRVTAENVKKFL